eukprot:TRINITY_DN5545_c0_g2_i2.p1 TRINITY_DN5545_c0_g2~~TRINITY_DN5545_c0_g2_i2.p1  ORF type:complete len:1231 (+),score=154.89 TRINITY_DN5545_c0_g2_i2:131-3823(+)
MQGPDDVSAVLSAAAAAAPSVSITSRGGLSLKPGFSSIIAQRVVAKKHKEPVKLPDLAESTASSPRKRVLRLTHPQSKLAFLLDHPFFDGTSVQFRERLAPQLVRRSQEDDTQVTVVEQGQVPLGVTDYLFLMGPDSHTKLEVLFDGRPIAVLGDRCVFGQEAILGVSKTFAFSVRVAIGAASSLWVVPRAVLQGLLAKEPYRQDALLLKSRSEQHVVSLLQSWYASPLAQISMRLFQNADHAFKSRLVQAMTMRVYRAGSQICAQGSLDDGCICVFRGEAHVIHEGETIVKLSHHGDTSAWAAWWGLLEVLGICRGSPMETVAVTDSLVWNLSSEALKQMRRLHPMECRLFDKVAMEHIKSLQEFSPDPTKLSIFQDADVEFITALAQRVTGRICNDGEIIMTEGEKGEDVFFLARGVAEARKSRAKMSKQQFSKLDAQAMLDNSSKVLALQVGTFFGELTALGFTQCRSASVVTRTICDFKTIHGWDIVRLVEKWPSMSFCFLKVAEENGYTALSQPLNGNLRDVAILSAMSDEFVGDLQSMMSTHLYLGGQLIFDQGSESEELYVLAYGSVSVEIDGVYIGEIKAPAVLGESALLNQATPRTASAGNTIETHWFRAKSVGVSVMRRCSAEVAVPMLLSASAETRLHLEEAGKVSISSVRDSLNGKRKSSIKQSEQESAFASEEDNDEEGEIDTEIMSVLENSELLKDSDYDFRAFLVRHMDRVKYVDQIMFKENESGDFAVIIEEGNCSVEVGGTRVGAITTGGLVGESAALGISKVRTATVRAVGVVSAFFLSNHAVNAAFYKFPKEEEKIKELVKLRSNVRNALGGKDSKKEEEGTPNSDHRGTSSKSSSGLRFRDDSNARRSSCREGKRPSFIGTGSILRVSKDDNFRRTRSRGESDDGGSNDGKKNSYGSRRKSNIGSVDERRRSNVLGFSDDGSARADDVLQQRRASIASRRASQVSRRTSTVSRRTSTVSTSGDRDAGNSLGNTRNPESPRRRSAAQTLHHSNTMPEESSGSLEFSERHTLTKFERGITVTIAQELDHSPLGSDDNDDESICVRVPDIVKEHHDEHEDDSSGESEEWDWSQHSATTSRMASRSETRSRAAVSMAGDDENVSHFEAPPPLGMDDDSEPEMKKPNKVQTWVRKRFQAMANADHCCHRQMAKSDRLLPLVPASCGYVADKEAATKNVAPWRGRLKKAKNIYGPPVWNPGKQLKSYADTPPMAYL